MSLSWPPAGDKCCDTCQQQLMLSESTGLKCCGEERRELDIHTRSPKTLLSKIKWRQRQLT